MKKNVWYRGVIVVGLLAIAQTANADWQKIDSLNSYSYITCFAASGTNIFAGTSKSGVFLSTDNGATWNPVNSGLGMWDTASGYYDPITSLTICGTNIFAGASYYGIFRSTDNGASWTPVDSGVPKNSNVSFPYFEILSLAVNGTNIFAGTNGGGIIRSNDNGASWTPVDSGLSKTEYGWPTNFYALAVSGTKIFAGGDDGVFLTADSGASWTRADSGLTNKPTMISSFAVSGSSLFAGTGYPGGSNVGVFLSTNNGGIWTPIDSGLPSKTTSVVSLAVSETTVFAGTNQNGVFLTNNNGTNWVSFNSGLGTTSFPAVYSLAVIGTNLFAGTKSGYGVSYVFRRPLSEIVNNLPSKPQAIPLQTKLNVSAFVTAQAGIKVNYSLASRCKVGLGIYTIAGEKLVSLEQGEQAPGTFSVSLPADKIQAGLYICRFQAGSCRENALVRVMK
jgi:photosystem II stability/assembly factor-like uncharacterized protein